MKLTTIIVLTACFAAALADVNELKNKPGRFLSLPNPEKCANRKLTTKKSFYVVNHLSVTFKGLKHLTLLLFKSC